MAQWIHRHVGSLTCLPLPPLLLLGFLGQGMGLGFTHFCHRFVLTVFKAMIHGNSKELLRFLCSKGQLMKTSKASQLVCCHAVIVLKNLKNSSSQSLQVALLQKNQTCKSPRDDQTCQLKKRQFRLPPHGVDCCIGITHQVMYLTHPTSFSVTIISTNIKSS